ncbi:MAG: hypothetical protein NXI02_31710 [Rhodobacteraceae bacterium]|nr:hypothetical protein [Paracoccaceae bacterium]
MRAVKGFISRVASAVALGMSLAGQVAAQDVRLIGPNTLRIDGTISVATEKSFHRLADEADIHTVELNSDGGQVYAALSIADRIHLQGINTWIKPGEECYSACALVFLAGKRRLADGILGVHQIYSEEENNSLTQAIVSDIFASLSVYGTPDELVALMLRTPPEEMYIFSPDEVERLGITRRQGEFELSHLQVVTSRLHGDWLVGTFLNTHTGQPFYALESRELDPVFRIVHYPRRNQTFGEIIWRDRTFPTGATDLRFVFERDANEHGGAGISEGWIRADLEELGYAWDFEGGEASIHFLNSFIYGHRLRIVDFSGRTVAQYGLAGTYRATMDFIELMGP